MNELLSLTVEPDEQGTTVRIAGDLDLASGPALQACLASQVADVVVVDLTEVPFIDSTGIAVLVAEHKRRVADNRRLIITGSSPTALRVFHATGVDCLLHLNGDSPHETHESP